MMKHNISKIILTLIFTTVIQTKHATASNLSPQCKAETEALYNNIALAITYQEALGEFEDILQDSMTANMDFGDETAYAYLHEDMGKVTSDVKAKCKEEGGKPVELDVYISCQGRTDQFDLQMDMDIDNSFFCVGMSCNYDNVLEEVKSSKNDLVEAFTDEDVECTINFSSSPHLFSFPKAALVISSATFFLSSVFSI